MPGAWVVGLTGPFLSASCQCDANVGLVANPSNTACVCDPEKPWLVLNTAGTACICNFRFGYTNASWTADRMTDPVLAPTGCVSSPAWARVEGRSCVLS
jgi:hypothetical protein